MGIKLLDKNVINQISAGEVVEKPASIVKELVENSIDAGATEITIDIKNGGIDLISVMDNGCGINKDEVQLAFMPHATSKLEKINDLDNLNTMGFRGEALASISAVSKVSMITKTDLQDTGIMIEINGGEVINSKEVACVTGTKIEVKEVFYNTPARLKFLRKPKTEENDITNYVEKLMLCNDHISFKYIVNGKIIYNTLSGSVINNLYSIYGKELADSMLEVNYHIGDYKVTGYVSKPECAKSNRSYQNLFVNKRFCNNALISTAVSNAYENFSMKGKFPVFVLFLSLPQNQLDVNVHPNKLEVKFENSQLVYRVCNDAVFKALSDFNHVRAVSDSVNDNFSNETKDLDNYKLNEIESKEGVSFKSEENITKQLEELQQNLIDSNKNVGSYHFNLTNNLVSEVNVNQYRDKEINNDDKAFVNNKFVENESNDKVPNINLEQITFKDVLQIEYKLIGTLFNTYLIVEYEDKVYFIDQHAAHERQKYDAIVNQVETNSLKLQGLLMPYTFKTNQAEGAFLSENLASLRSFGIDISEFGFNSFKVSAVPILMSDINLKDFFEEVLSNLSSLIKSPFNALKIRFMQMACKSAVKGGDNLSDLEIKTLLKTLKNQTEILLCPHGRPIVIELTKKQIEKWFKRIV